MTDAFRPAPNSSSSAVGNPESGRAFQTFLRAIAYLGICCTVGVMGYATYQALQARSVEQDTVEHLTELRGLVRPTHRHLAPDYFDTDDNLLADPPAAAADLLDPQTLVVAHYVDADVEQQLIDWTALQGALSQALGKNVILQEYQNTAADVAAIKTGLIQLVAMHAADAPYVVNNAGFVPVAVLGTEAGANGNRLDIAVNAASKIQTLADIRDRKLTCTAPDSMTGYRAAIIVLSQQAGLRPDIDYSINFSLGQKRSVLGLVSGEYSVAALSDDKVRSMLKNGSLEPTDYRVIYQSEVIPRLTIGYVYNLDPTLAAKVSSTILSFENQSGAPDEVSGEPLRFFPIDYKDDFVFVRNVDDNFDPRFFKGVKTKPTPARPAQPAQE
jgi:phosphonate transport system substrate-binding protein